MQIPSLIESLGSLDEPLGPGVGSDPGPCLADPLAGEAATVPGGSLPEGNVESATPETGAGSPGGRAERPNRTWAGARRPDRRGPHPTADATLESASFAAIVAAWAAGPSPSSATVPRAAVAPPSGAVSADRAGRPTTDPAHDAEAAAAGDGPAQRAVAGEHAVDVAAWLAAVIPTWAPGSAVAPAKVGHGAAGDSPTPDVPSSSQPSGNPSAGELGPAEPLASGPDATTAPTTGRVPATPPFGPLSPERSVPTATADPRVSPPGGAVSAAETSGSAYRRPTALGEAVDPAVAERGRFAAAAEPAPERSTPPERSAAPERPATPVPKATPAEIPAPDAVATTALGSATVARAAPTEPVDPPARAADAAAAAERLLTAVAERLRLTVRDRLQTLEATFHDPALGPVRLAVRGLPDGPIAADLVVASAHTARALGRAAGELRSLAEAGIELRIRIESGASPAAATESRVEVRAGHGHPAAAPASGQSGPTTDDGRRFPDDAGGPGSDAGRQDGREPAADGGGGAPAGSEMAIAATRSSRRGRPLGGRSPATRPSLGPGLAAGAIDLRL